MDRLDVLSWMEEIKQLKGRYFRCVDIRDWQSLRTVFAPDAKLTYPESRAEPYDVDSAMEVFKLGLEGVTSVHHGHMPEIEIQSPTAATGIWAMEDLLLWSADSKPARGRHRARGYGHYHETYGRYQDRWVIQTLRLSRLVIASHNTDATDTWTVFNRRLAG